MRILWVTDIHLNVLRISSASQLFGEYLASEHDFDLVLITGDIAEAISIQPLLNDFADGIGRDTPIAFVLGNHDYYGASISAVHKMMARKKGWTSNLFWLDPLSPTELTPDIGLVGHYAWYDGRNGAATTTDFFLTDFKAVSDFRAVIDPFKWIYQNRTGSRIKGLALFRKLADSAVATFEKKLRTALQRYQKVIVATHVPPFAGSAWHEGKVSDAMALPWFSCKAMGDMLERVAAEHSDRQILVLCGHSHSPGEYQHAHNLKVLTGKAVYGSPDVAGLITEASFDGW